MTACKTETCQNVTEWMMLLLYFLNRFHHTYHGSSNMGNHLIFDFCSNTPYAYFENQLCFSAVKFIKMHAVQRKWVTHQLSNVNGFFRGNFQSTVQTH